jgi:hypothetical protein
MSAFELQVWRNLAKFLEARVARLAQVHTDLCLNSRPVPCSTKNFIWP